MSDSNEIVPNLFLDTGGDKWIHHRQAVAIAVSGWHVHIRMNWRSLLLLFTYITGEGKFIYNIVIYRMLTFVGCYQHVTIYSC